MKAPAMIAIFCLGSRAWAALPALLQGNSAWAYTMDASNAAAINSYEASAPPNGHFKYFFPDCASVDIGPAGSRTFNISAYGSAAAMVSFYKGLLPNAMIMPIIESGCGGNCGTIFNGWSVTDMQWAADQTAAFVTTTASTWGSIGGIHLDLETYHDSHLAYYLRLRQDLNALGYRLSFFAPVSSNSQFFSAADFVVFSGYDLGLSGGTAETPGAYGNKLGTDVSGLMNLAQATGGYLMVGLPLAASTTEFETYLCGSCGAPAPSGYSQSQYVSAAAEVLCPYTSNAHFLGVSAWVMELTGNSYTPAAPSQASWNILSGLTTMPCSSTAPVAPAAGSFKVSGVLGAPNPSRGHGSLCFNFNGAAVNGKLELYSSGYAKVWQQDLPASELGSGEHCLPFDPSQEGLANGIYYLGVSASGADGNKSFLNSTFLILK
jgi:hypothetical protein